MKKFIITFGSGQLKGFHVNPAKVMLVLEGETEMEAREVMFKQPFEGKFCTSYPYESNADEFKQKYGMVEITLEQLLKRKEILDI